MPIGAARQQVGCRALVLQTLRIPVEMVHGEQERIEARPGESELHMFEDGGHGRDLRRGMVLGDR